MKATCLRVYTLYKHRIVGGCLQEENGRLTVYKRKVGDLLSKKGEWEAAFKKRMED